jgi:hypothetical protein
MVHSNVGEVLFIYVAWTLSHIVLLPYPSADITLVRKQSDGIGESLERFRGLLV